MKLDAMTMTDLAAMFAMQGLLARGDAGLSEVTNKAYDYADRFIKEKQQREQENEDE